MAIINIVNTPVGIVRGTSGLAYISEQTQSESWPTQATSQPGNFTAGNFGSNGGVWIITATGGNIAVAFGENPIATDQSIVILAGQTREFYAKAGDKIAAIDFPF